MSRLTVNLARQPFVNHRPVLRVTVALWVLGALLLMVNAWLYRSFFVGSSARSRRLAEIDGATAAERARIAELEAEISGLDLGRQNTTASFLNRKISARTFAWSRLFDRLTALLPTEVRLIRLQPEAGNERQRRSGAEGRNNGADASAGAEIPLTLLGETKSDGALLELVDALFADPAFRDPNPRREARGEGQTVRFDLTVTYLPQVAAALAAGDVGLAEEESAETPPQEEEP